jgi:hypothetical protein
LDPGDGFDEVKRTVFRLGLADDIRGVGDLDLAGCTGENEGLGRLFEAGFD